MLSFLQSLLPRLKKFSQSLDQKELFIDKPWVLIDEDGQQQTYIFRRGGELLMSLDGQVRMGTWDYIASAQSLLIDRGADKLLLNHLFFTEALLILARDGKADSKFVLANRQLIPDLDVERYLRVLEAKEMMQMRGLTGSVITTQLQQSSVKTGTGLTLEFFSLNSIISVGDAVYAEGKPASDGRYLTEEGWGMVAKDGCVANIFWPKKYKLQTGEDIIVESNSKKSDINIGANVFQINDASISDGKYNVVGVGRVRIANGRVAGFPLL